MQNRHVMVPAVYVLIKNKEGKILGLLRENTGYMDGYWTVPSGHVEKEELPIKAAIRETKEESGLDLLAEDLQFVHLMIRPKTDDTGERSDIFFEASKWSGEPINTELGKHAEIKWLDPKDDAIKWMSFEKDAFKMIEEGIKYSEWRK